MDTHTREETPVVGQLPEGPRRCGVDPTNSGGRFQVVSPLFQELVTISSCARVIIRHRSHQDSMERVMARIFRQKRTWIGEGGLLSREGVVRWDREMLQRTQRHGRSLVDAALFRFLRGIRRNGLENDNLILFSSSPMYCIRSSGKNRRCY